ncbi:RNA polymerase sigma factor [Microbacterium sp. NPDC077663]|uniref:RNA polymerase sigma factor n=1 Tax=Microbacterium sp. NPDC077663 TaxID=3364189 RepID=UPI0037C802E2
MSHADRRRRFEEIARDVIEPVRRYVDRRAHAADVDDVVSETLLALWRRLDDIPAEHIAWAIGVARLQLANTERAARRRDRLSNRIRTLDPPHEAAPVADDGVDDAVRLVLRSLRPADAEMLRLWSWEQLEPREIAVVLGISANAATVRLHRARKKFADAWRKEAASAGHVEVKERSGR